MSVESVLLGRVVRLEQSEVLALLRRVAVDRGIMLDLRRLLAEETARSAMQGLSDNVVLMQIAERVTRGELSLSMVRNAEPLGPPEGDPGEAAEAAPEEVIEASEIVVVGSAETEEMPSLTGSAEVDEPPHIEGSGSVV